jgi:hypothetical protein
LMSRRVVLARRSDSTRSCMSWPARTGRKRRRAACDGRQLAGDRPRGNWKSGAACGSMSWGPAAVTIGRYAARSGAGQGSPAQSGACTIEGRPGAAQAAPVIAISSIEDLGGSRPDRRASQTDRVERNASPMGFAIALAK